MNKPKSKTSKAYLFFCILLPFYGNAQDNGIKFESGLSWQEIQAKAKAEHKPIFMDCYATWCGPCKDMERTIYPNMKVGEFFNSHFINVKVQMDSTGKDAKDIQDWYTDAKALRDKYRIGAYPTYLFFSDDGQAIHKFVGASQSGEEYISKASDALDPNRQYYTLLEKEKAGITEDSNFLLRATLAAKGAGDEENARRLVNKYIASLTDPITQANINLYKTYMVSESDKGFELFVQNAAKIDQIAVAKGTAEEVLAKIIFNEEIAPQIMNNKTPIRWKEITEQMASKYPTLDKGLLKANLDLWFKIAIGKEISNKIHESQSVDWLSLAKELNRRFSERDYGQLFFSAKARYCYKNKEWDECAKATELLIDRYGKQMGGSVNDYIWRCIFLHSSNRKIIKSAIKSMEWVVKIAPEDVYCLDTYANLLYKSGQRQKGIDWEMKAIDVCKKKLKNASDLEDTLKKMQKGEITWGDNVEE